MYGNGIDFTTENGPMIEGTWFNPMTGDQFTVQDSYFQDGQLVVKATDGRVLDYNIIQNYVKAERPNDIPKLNKQKQEKPRRQELPPEIVNEIEGTKNTGILPEDMEIINRGQAPVQTPVTVPGINFTNNQPEDEDTRLIKRVLDRAKKDPELDVKLSWSKYPNKQMEMLVDYMGVDVEKIVDYYIGKIDLNKIRQNIQEEIQKFIEKKFSEESEEEKLKSSESKPERKKK